MLLAGRGLETEVCVGDEELYHMIWQGIAPL